ncbi:MAG TPA: hypothetical protein VFS76_15010 [Pyrinomonadaceae bacterium]|nr:hypothetical protein [Pyrinomonadaceae bacterium]
MELDPVYKALVGGFFVIAGLVMVVFHKDLKTFHDELVGVITQFNPLYPRGRALTIMTLVFGVLSIIGGGLVVLSVLAD